MEARIHKFGFAANFSSNAFKVLGSSPEVGGAGYCADTVLRLDSPNFSVPCLSNSTGIKRKWSLIDGTVDQLSLGLGRSSSSSDSKGSSATACTTMSSAKETDEESSMDLELDFTLHLGSEKIPTLKRPDDLYPRVSGHPNVDLELSLFTGRSESDIARMHPKSSFQIGSDIALSIGGVSHLDEGSTSSHLKTCVSLPTRQNVPAQTSFFSNQIPGSVDPTLVIPDLSSSVITTLKSSVTCTSGITLQQQAQQRSKTCQIEGCGKGARGASGHCISHGGGRRCKKPGCDKGAEGRTVYCKAHGGGRRCEHLGCTKSAEGRTDYCIAHGGGRRCSHEGCIRAARGKSGLCIRHGGGKRCQKDNCTKSAEGLSGLCISHGGGRRCQAIECTKGAQGSTLFCKAHGGGKRCTALGCTKGAEGSTPFCKGHGGGKRCAFQGGGVCTKSVHGGTNFCVAHGGGKRCSVPECTKSARGRTNFCVRHGGGKRCKFEGCGKSAQGSTDFCKAHGGGKRCSWGHPGSENGSQATGPCNSFARGKTGLCILHSGLVQDKRVHGGATLGLIVQDETDRMKEIGTHEDMNVDTMEISFALEQYGTANAHLQVGEGSVSFPEGRVHGGSLMMMLASSSDLGSGSGKGIVGIRSHPRNSCMTLPHSYV